MAGIPSGATLTVLSDGNTPNTGKWIGRLSGTYTAADMTLDATSYPSASKIGLGIKPNHIRVTNLDDRISMEATYGSTSGLLTVAAGTRTYVAHGFTWGDRSVVIPASTNSLFVTNKTMLFEIQS